MTFLATKAHVLNRGSAPDGFLTELVEWARTADHALFLPNDVPLDIYGVIRPVLGPWRLTEGEAQPYLVHRRAAMCEAMRVHAGFESSWNWNEGVDTTNKTSVANIEGQETGIFQVSHDSLKLDKTGNLKAWLALNSNTSGDDALEFIKAMKAYHECALGYYARLVRINTRWAGPLARGEILPWLKTDAVSEFARLIG